jgi:type IV secretory pathway TrbF-like protein
MKAMRDDECLPPGDPLTAPYIRGRREWDERTGDALSRERWWRALAFLALVILGGSVAGNVYQGAQSKVETLHVVHDNIGRVISVDVSGGVEGGPTQAMVAVALQDWISDIRTVYTDVAALKNGITKAYALIQNGSQAEAFVNQFYNDDDPFNRAKKITVSVYQPVGVPPPPSSTTGPGREQTWTVDWQETATGRADGLVKSRTSWTAKLTIRVIPPTPSTLIDEVRKNPNGIHISGISWTPR